MALSATFTANFSSFYDAVDKADAKLKSFGDGADKVGGRLNTLANQFSGQKIVQEATIMAKAVEEIGGVTKLTEKELARLGATATEAVAKMKALGMDVPKNLQEIADKTKAVTKATTETTTATTNWAGSLKSIAGALGIGFGVKQVLDFGKAIVEDASHIADLSAKIGVSAEAVQRFGFAAEQTGASMDTIGASITKMNANLAGGSDSTKAALDQIGLQFKDIRAMKPEEAFESIAQAIARIPDPMLQAKVAMELFGKTGADLLPAINQGLIDIGNSADVMSDKTVAAWDRIGDAWDRLVHGVKVAAADVLPVFEKHGNYLFGLSPTDVKTIADEIDFQLLRIADDATRAAIAAASVGVALKNVKDPMAGLDAAAKPLAGLMEHYGLATEQAKKQTDDFTASENKAAAAAAAHKQKIADLAAELSGAGLTQKVKDLDEATKLAVKTWGSGVLQSKALVDQVMALGKAGAALTPTLQQIYDRNLAWATVTGKVRVAVSDLLHDLPSVTKELTEFNKAAFPTIAPSSVKVTAASLLPNLPNLAPQVTKWAEQTLTEPMRKAAQESSAAIGLIGVAFDAIGQTGSQTFAGMMRLADTAIEGLVRYRLATDAAQKSTIALNTAAGIATFGIGTLVQAGIEMYQADVAAAQYSRHIGEIAAKLRELGATPELKKGGGFFGGLMIGPNLEKQLADLQAKMAKALDDARGKVGDLQTALQKFGGVVPPSLRPAIEALLKMKGIPDDMKKSLEGLTKDPSWQALEARAKELGIDLAGLGTQFSQAKLGEIGLGYARDLQMFADAGANMQIVLEGMSDELGDLYTKAKQTGVKLPDTLKPYMETLVAQGRLLDENGQAIDHLDDDAFVHIEDTGLKDVVSVLEQIAELLKEALPKSAETAAKGVQDAFAKHPINVPVNYQYPGFGPVGPGGGEDPGTGGGTSPRFPFRQPTTDAVVDWGSVPAGSSASSAPIDITVVSQLDGREVARNQVKYIPGELNRAGL